MNYQIVLVGAGHAHHILAGDKVLCGVDKRRDGDGRLPIINSHSPFRADRVDCTRCRKKLRVGAERGEARMIAAADKRWDRRRELWVVPPVVFSPAGYAVDVVAEAAARRYVEEHHYSGSFPAARLSVGIFGPQSQLAGVAVFSVPMNPRVAPRYTGQTDGVELGRFVCSPSVAFNGETWFLARAFRLLRQEKAVEGVVSYADPLERRTAAGELMKRAHWGTIYQASNALLAGRSDARTLILAADGRVVSGRALAKISNEERGWEYAARQLLDAGAPARWPWEDLRSWVDRALRAPCFRRVRHPGNLAYVFGLTTAARRRIQALHAGGQPYPRAVAA